MDGKRAYYNVAGMEAYDVMHITEMQVFECSAFKYLYRCNNVLPKGDRIGDLQKAHHYVEKMLEFPLHIRTNKGERILALLNKDVFSSNIYNAICEIITAVAIAGSNYNHCSQNALEYIENELKLY